jgi:hypothetical protein
MEILEDRKDSISGEDIKNIVESIAISESIIEPVAIDPKAKTEAQLLSEWRGE